MGRRRGEGGLKISCNAVSASLDAPTKNVHNIQYGHADQPGKIIRDTLPHPRVVSVVLSWLETTHFEECVHARHFVHCYTTHYVINMFIASS